jgi:hypothetical protein
MSVTAVLADTWVQEETNKQGGEADGRTERIQRRKINKEKYEAAKMLGKKR